jgi:peptidoglycan-associated lipoprotein
MRVEGHTDERGSSEYNIALGERRAQTVARYMESQGAPSSQIVVVSYGREKPATQGHDESAWKFNRRAVLVYEAK